MRFAELIPHKRADATCGNAKTKLLKHAALPLPFAARAGRSAPLLPTCLQPAGAGAPNQSTDSTSGSDYFQLLFSVHVNHDKSIAS